jgi:menaquinone-dependent protoporphyrinogen oxidase
MKTAILYASKHGAAKKCAELLKYKIFGSELVDIKEKPDFDVMPFDTVIIGGSVYIGRLRPVVIKYCAKNIELLKTKKLGLFIVCMMEKGQAERELKNNFPAELYERATAKDYFGGIFDFSKLNFLERFVVRKIVKVKESVFRIKEEKISAFAEKLR